MAVHSTAYHAVNLFSLTMERQHGAKWRQACSGATIAASAAEVARGYGGVPLTAESGPTSAVPTVWQLPDGSLIRTGAFGLTEDTAAAESAA